MIHPPTITTERLILKAVTEADEPSYRKQFVDYEVIRHLTSKVPWPYPEDGVIEHLEIVLSKQGKDKWVWATIPERSQPLIRKHRCGLIRDWLGRTPN